MGRAGKLDTSAKALGSVLPAIIGHFARYLVQAFTGMANVAICGAGSVWLKLRESQAARRIAPSESAPTAD